ncbi:hypothetical protein GLOIN_2v1770079 [Rhizophagus irregularis DAOM 181602=DAOM 197198]|nr:hypothetical protein GLOIN_2v1770079 [Rhizophagus irregularis DAOM 181602=DAOM 197198]
MDKNMHKCSIFDVYSSEKKKISDVNKLQEDFESESTLSSSSIEDSNKKRAILDFEALGETTEVQAKLEIFMSYRLMSLKLMAEGCSLCCLEKGDTFEDWKSAEKQVEIYLKVVGFGVIKRHLEKNSYGEIIRCTFEC